MAEASKTKSSTDESSAVAKDKKVDSSKKTVASKKTATKPAKAAAKPSKAAAKPVAEKKPVGNAEVTKEEAKDTKASEKPETKADKPLAKAGKHSAKALKEAEEKAEKEARKATAKDETPAEKPKKAQKPARPKLERRSKKFRKASEQLEKDKEYSLKEGLELATKTSTTKFDATVELHVNLGVDPRQADQNVRDTVILPAGSGKTVRIAVFADVDDAAAGKKAGADIAGIEEVSGLLDKETLNFDVLIATPTQMQKLGKYARLLGPRGLMPNPKSGTVTTDVAKAVKEAKAGKVEYRVDSTGIVHMGVGKVSFGTEKLLQNTEAVMASIRSVKPASLKGTYVKSVYITTTMGPGIKVQTSSND